MLGQLVSHIIKDVDRVLSKCAEFCAMLKDEFQIMIELTGTYSSWSNENLECHSQTACNMIRVGTIAHGLGDHLQCYKYNGKTKKYTTTVNSVYGEVPDYLWCGKCL